MSSPQLEDGYTRFAHELLESIMFNDFSKREMKLILAIARKTYGWHKKWDRIDLGQFCGMTNLKKNHISTTLKDLVEKNVVLKHSEKRVSFYAINKNYSEWVNNAFMPGGDIEEVTPEILNEPGSESIPKQDLNESQNGTRTNPNTGLGVVPKQDSNQSQNGTRGSPKMGLACG